MESEQPKEDCATSQPTPAPPSETKKPNPPPYVPKQRLPASKDKAQTQGEVKPRPRPRYTDKARKNAKNKKDKAGGEGKSAAVEDGGEIQNSDTKPDVKEEPLEDAEVEVKEQLESASLEADVASRLEAISLVEEEEEEEEEESWDTLFNDEGDSLEQHLPAELAVKQGRKKKSNQGRRFDYSNMDQEEEDDEEGDFRDDEISNIVEIYDFPAEFKTDDLLKLFQAYQQRGFDIKWIDEVHVIGLFSSPIAAREALRSKHPLMKLRPLSKSSAEVQAKARSSSEDLLPAKDRPQTSAAMARRLVIGALGVKNNQSDEQREAEKRKLLAAKEQKRLEAKLKEDAWEGK
ncbi:coiled-coil domain-containing protein R3HCC1L [Platichthys flesus]|uniref:coiled-coil domain-containing protein R3HCC1L n=1 Tax=Platichthys flesus TaxID=8260 RepID=UPI002DBD86D6|nr:coiled-coil domain-containing protein R3HCC1L [Platichthys flesus]